MKRIVITGGTYAGKSSLVECFRKVGIKAVPDIGFEIIKELNDELGLEGQKKFRLNNPVEFYTKIIKKQLEIEKQLKSEIVVFDRGAHDYIAMLKLTSTVIPESLMKLAGSVSYDIVFVCDTLSSFDGRKKSGRSLTKEDSLRLSELAESIYQKLGCKVITVKEMPLKERFEFIKSCL